jgi:hypothetical protein
MLKVALATYPIILAGAITWSVWVTANIFELRAFAQQGPRWTAQDAELQTAIIKEWTEGRFKVEVPPKVVIERLTRLERDRRRDAKISAAQQHHAGVDHHEHSVDDRRIQAVSTEQAPSFRPDPAGNGGAGICTTRPEPRCDPLERAIRLVEAMMDTPQPGRDRARFGDRVVVEVIRGGNSGGGTDTTIAQTGQGDRP